MGVVRVGAIVALGLAIVVVGAYLVIPHSNRHLDGDGPLGSGDGPGHSSFASDPIGSHSTEFTYGVTLCLVSGDNPAVIESVTPDRTLGSGFTYLGMGLRVFSPSNGHEPIISYWAYPPPPGVVPDQIRPVVGFAVTTPCVADPSAELTELLIGISAVGNDGGGWEGLDVAYSSGGQQLVVFINHDLLICGASLPDQCRGPGGSPNPS